MEAAGGEVSTAAAMPTPSLDPSSSLAIARRVGPPGSWLSFAQTYGLATEVLGRPIPGSERVQLWGTITAGQGLSLIASMLRDLDLAEKTTVAIEAGWVGVVADPGLKMHLEAATRAGLRLLAPQLLLLAALEAIEHCAAGDPRPDHVGVDVVFTGLLSIAEESAGPRQGAELWGGLDSGLAAELVANQYFNHAVSPVDQMAWANNNWRAPWPRPSVPEALIRRAGGEPSDLFLEATGTDVDDFTSVGVHLWVQAQQRQFLRFPSEFFDLLGIERAAVDRFLNETSTDLASLKAAVQVERARTGSSRWAFHSLRRHPIIRLDNGEWLVLRLGFVIERALGDVTHHDVRNHLREVDAATGSKRDEAFRGCLARALESHVGDSLERTFPALGGERRVFGEVAMQKAWTTKKNQVPSVCDYAVDCGDVWLLFDVTDRRLPENLINGTADAAALDDELDVVLTDKKAKQFASTVRNLKTDMATLVGHQMVPGTRFVCVVVTPNGGLGWTPAVSNRAKERLSELGVLQGAATLPLAIMSVKEVNELERAVETGQSGSGLLTDWRTNGEGVSFEQVLLAQGIPLGFGDWTRRTGMALIDDLVGRMRANAEQPGDSGLRPRRTA